MINREDLIKIGKFNKLHGIQGELSFSFTNDLFDEAENPFLICELNGIFVPFRLTECRFTSGSTALVKLNTIDSENKARRLVNHEVYFSKNQIRSENEDETCIWDYFIGFCLIDEKAGEVGVITAVDDSTMNTLFILEKNKKEILVPAAKELITHIDHAGKKIFIALPEGLLAI